VNSTRRPEKFKRLAMASAKSKFTVSSFYCVARTLMVITAGFMALRNAVDFNIYISLVDMSCRRLNHLL